MKQYALPATLVLVVGCLLVSAVPARLEQAPNPADRFEVSDVMIPARDGVKLHTKIFTPRNQSGPLPIILKRTPYGIEGSANNFNAYYKALADEGYIFVFQDIRGKFGSEGTFVMQRPARAAGRHEVPGRGHRHLRHHRLAAEERAATTTAASACSACPTTAGPPSWPRSSRTRRSRPMSPQASPADMWLGDDFHHNGAFRLSYGFEYAAMMESGKDVQQFAFDRYDTFDWYLNLGLARQRRTPSTCTARFRPGTTTSRIPTTTTSGSARRWCRT